MGKGIGYRSDKRYSPQNRAAKAGRASAEPRQVSRARPNNDLAERKKIHAESTRRNQWTEKAQPVVSQEKTRRE
jgi:hypothetical protein